MLHAVVVGVDEYRDRAIPPLSCAKSDAAAVAALISDRIATEERNVVLLLDGQATRANIMTAIAEDLPRRVESEDIVLIYFAGHGSPERISVRDKRARYLLSHDTEFARIHTTGLGLDRDVADWFEGLQRAQLVVLVLDACFSGAAGGRTIMGPILQATPTLPVLADPGLVSLRELKLGRGRIILCAADDNQLAREDVSKGHGLFTRHLLTALRRPRTEPTIDLMELYGEVERAVRNETGDEQDPVISVIKGAHPRLPAFNFAEGALATMDTNDR